MMFVPDNKSDIQDIVNKAGEVENVRMMTADWVSQLIGVDNCKTREMSEQLDTDKDNYSKSDRTVKAKKLWLKFGEVWDMALFKEWQCSVPQMKHKIRLHGQQENYETVIYQYKEVV